MEAQQTEKFECWCVVEVFGHQTFAGYVSERTIGGAALIQVDVPEVDEAHPAFTKLFGSAAIYAITPTTEAHAREAAAQIRVRPVTLYILPEAKSAPRLAQVADYLDPEGDYDRYRDDDDDGGFEGDDDEVDDFDALPAEVSLSTDRNGGQTSNPDDGVKVEELSEGDDNPF